MIMILIVVFWLKVFVCTLLPYMHRAPDMTDESSQRSASLTDVVAVRGGGIPLDASLGDAWILAPDVIEGRRFVDIYTRDSRCAKYFDGNYLRVNHLKK